MTIASVPTSSLNMFNGTRDGEAHIVLAFPVPGRDLSDTYIVDMTRMQYGEAGRGQNGEPYYFGLAPSYWSSMTEICANLQITAVTEQRLPHGPDPVIVTRLKHCAQKVFHRWLNRFNEGWCDYCGKGGKELFRCHSCQNKQFFYCCRRHQVAGWKLHRYICENTPQ